jgi:hypothetical protein
MGLTFKKWRYLGKLTSILTVRATNQIELFTRPNITTPNRKKLRSMLDEDNLADPGSPVKDLETKLSPYKTQLLTDI